MRRRAGRIEAQPGNPGNTAILDREDVELDVRGAVTSPSDKSLGREMNNPGNPPTSIQDYAKRTAVTLNAAGALASRLSLPAGLPDKYMVAWTLLRVSFDHAASIHSLLYHHGIELSGSAFALLRPMNEALKRGAWIALCATDDQVQTFITKDKLPKVNLAEQIEQVPPFNEFPLFSKQHANAWDKFHSFTHAGSQMVGAYTQGESVGPAFPPELIIEVLNHAEAIAMMVVQIMVMIAGDFDPNLGHAVLGELNEIIPTAKRP